VSNKADQSPANAANNALKGYATERGLDISTARSGLQMAYNPINRDIYEVFAEGTHDIAGTQENAGAVVTQFSMNKYVPVNRILQYDTQAVNVPIHRLWVIYWWDNPIIAGAGASIATQLLRAENKIYYEEHH
jgi:hypothetical protein